MRTKIAIFYHMLTHFGDPPELRMEAFNIVTEQMEQLRESGLLDACEEMIVGCNGGKESEEVARLLIPSKAKIKFHGLQSKAENLTLIELERWAPLHLDWNILYFHAKGCTHAHDSDYGNRVSAPWRRTMMWDLVTNWKECVSQLDSGADIVCSHWMWNMGSDQSQHIPAGNFLWVKSRFAANLPSMYLRDRIKESGIASAESRFEAEVKWGNGMRPIVSEMRPGGGEGVP